MLTVVDTSDHVAEYVQAFGMILVALFVVIGGPLVYKQLHFKVGKLEATVGQAASQLNGRTPNDTTVSADVALIKDTVLGLFAQVNDQSARLTAVSTRLLNGDGQYVRIDKAMVEHEAAIKQIGVDVNKLEIAVHNQGEMVNALSERQLLIQEGIVAQAVAASTAQDSLTDLQERGGRRPARQ